MKKLFCLLFVIGMCLSFSTQISAETVDFKSPVLMSGEKIKKSGSNTYCYRNGKKVTNQLVKLSSGTYYFGKDGKAVKKVWKTISKKRYYFGSDGKAYKGLKKIGSSYYYFKYYGDAQVSSWRTIDNKRYYFDSNGACKPGLKTIGKEIYYFGSKGYATTNQLVTTGGKTYYFGKGGKAIKNALKILDNTYYFGEDGAALSSKWKEVKGKRYYFSKSGKAYVGLKKVGSSYYYFKAHGDAQVSSWRTINSKRYFFNSKGATYKGLKKISGETYYFNSKGYCSRNTLKSVNGKIYYFGSGGKAIKNTFKVLKPDRYYFGSDGVAYASKWATIDGKKYYFNSKGTTYAGVKNVGDYTYVFHPYGYIYRGYRVVDDQMYYLDHNGRSVEGLYEVSVAGKLVQRYFNGDGSVVKSQFKTIEDKLFFFTKDGILCKTNWRNVQYDQASETPLYIHTDDEGVVAQGMTTFEKDGLEAIFYFDQDVINGYRIGNVQVGEDIYRFNVGAYMDSPMGSIQTGLYTDLENNKLYNFGDDGILQTSGTYTIEGVDLTFDINSDGSFVIDSDPILSDNDDARTKLMKVAFSQMFKLYKHYSFGYMKPMDLADIDGYSCSGYVLRMLYELTQPEEYFSRNHDIAYQIYLDKINEGRNYKIYSKDIDPSVLKPGDLVIFNKEDCATDLNDLDDAWMIDQDEDGICDRIHEEEIPTDDGKTIKLHVHHVGFYVGNGRYIDAHVDKGVLVEDYDMTNVVAYMSILD